MKRNIVVTAAPTATHGSLRRVTRRETWRRRTAVPAADSFGEARWATPDDDAQLRRLARAVPMVGRVSYCLEREPDYFRLLRLQGNPAHAAVIDGRDEAVAMAACAVQSLTFAGQAERLLYTCDAKVHPAYRGQGLFGAIVERALSEVDALGVIAAYTLVLKGNRAMASMIANGVRGMRFHRLATIRNFTLFLGRERALPAGSRVRPASIGDLPAMVALWQRAASERHLCPDLSLEAFRTRFAQMPGLGPESFRIVERGGEMTGFAAAWDLHPLKQVRLLGLSVPLRIVRALYNPVARTAGRAPLPKFGEHLRFAYVMQLCARSVEDARALLVQLHNDLRGSALVYLDLALDIRDPHLEALRGFALSSVDFELFLLTWKGGAPASALPGDRPMYFEMGLV